jgi:oligopeptide transport system ATP-binding protein
MSSEVPMLDVRGLRKHFPLKRRGWFQQAGQLRAVDGVDFTVERGTTLALVGESGCGKTTVGRTVLQLYRPTAGKVLLDGVDLASLDVRELRRTRSRMQIVFQDPNGSLNPRIRVGDSIAEPLRIHRRGTAREIQDRVRSLLCDVGLDPSAAERFPHEFSGGQRQRIGIARAIALDPELVIADEPTSALDVSIRVQILNLLVELQRRRRIGYLFITHDLAVVRHYSDRIAVMHAGRIVELASTVKLFADPRHPYTRLLLSSAPVPDPARRRPDMLASTSDFTPATEGCPFAPRCPFVAEQCRTVEPVLGPLSNDPNRLVACHLAETLPAIGSAPPVSP